MVGVGVEKVVVDGGSKPKLAGPHTWVRFNFFNGSNRKIATEKGDLPGD